MNQTSKEDTTIKGRVTPKSMAIYYMVLLVIGYGLFGFAIGHGQSQLRAGHIVRIAGIAVSILSWLVVLSMTKLQNYRYLLSILAQQFKQGRLPLDERETQLRRKVYEQSYIVLIIFLMVGGFYLLFEGHSLSFTGFWMSRLAVWLWLNLLVLFIFLPSLIAAKNDDE